MLIMLNPGLARPGGRPSSAYRNGLAGVAHSRCARRPLTQITSLPGDGPRQGKVTPTGPWPGAARRVSSAEADAGRDGDLVGGEHPHAADLAASTQNYIKKNLVLILIKFVCWSAVIWLRGVGGGGGGRGGGVSGWGIFLSPAHHFFLTKLAFSPDPLSKYCSEKTPNLSSEKNPNLS